MDIQPVLMASVVFATMPVLITPPALLLSNIFDSSVLFKQKLKDRISLSRTYDEALYNRKLLKGTQELRCKIGSFYYMEARAKLTLVNTIIHMVVFMLLLK
jgi:hypothetical protein